MGMFSWLFGRKNHVSLGEKFDRKQEVIDKFRDVLGNDWEDIYYFEYKGGKLSVNRYGDSCDDCCC